MVLSGCTVLTEFKALFLFSRSLMRVICDYQHCRPFLSFLHLNSVWMYLEFNPHFNGLIRCKVSNLGCRDPGWREKFKGQLDTLGTELHQLNSSTVKLTVLFGS